MQQNNSYPYTAHNIGVALKNMWNHNVRTAETALKSILHNVAKSRTLRIFRAQEFSALAGHAAIRHDIWRNLATRRVCWICMYARVHQTTWVDYAIPGHFSWQTWAKVMFEPHPLNMTSRFTILYGTQDRLIMIALPVTNISNDIYNKIALLQYNETNLTIRNLEVRKSQQN